MEEELSRSVAKEGVFGLRDIQTIWYVFKPIDVDREEWIANCIRTNTVSIINNNNEIINNVSVGKIAIQLIEWPDPDNGRPLGSPVGCGNITYHNQPVITEVYSFQDEYEDFDENEYKFIKKSDKSEASVSIRGDKGEIVIDVSSEEDDGGQVDINVRNDSDSAKLNINVNGTLLVRNIGSTTVESSDGIFVEIFDGNVDEKKTFIRYRPREGFTYFDEFGNKLLIRNGVDVSGAGKSIEIEDHFGNKVDFSNGKIQTEANEIVVKGNTIKLRNGGEPLILGQKLVDFLNDLITQVGAITVTTQLGVQPILNKTAVEALAADLEDLKSTVSSTD